MSFSFCARVCFCVFRAQHHNKKENVTTNECVVFVSLHARESSPQRERKKKFCVLCPACCLTQVACS